MSESQWQQNIEKLNSTPELHLFQVGPSGILFGGDIELSKGPEDEFEATIKSVKPGIWHVAITREKGENSPFPEFKHAIARWVAPGTLNVAALSAPFPEPNLSPLSDWKKVDSYSVDSGCHGIIDKDGLQAKIEEEGEDREYVLETVADLSHEDKVSAEIGFIIGGDDGGYRIWVREHEGKRVEVKVQPNYEEDDAEDGEEEEEADEDDE
ncbi:hypothetical protein EIP91_004724 [Steccherinum ochraceum]|uniref:Uncharacterized protein n=1 Tax=Steccherinum ochraceum TaxID=92696 RepID=A0A4R0RAV0_9APHY|nr:hypothetical protein EIP91_004724 [Steccherinum ochraceum]